MHGASFVTDLAIVLLVASGTGLLFRRLGQPSIVGYLAAGLIVGPYIPIPIFADEERIHSLSEVGVVLVMFVVGLELRLRRLIEVLPTAGATALIEVAALLGAGFTIGQLLGWSSSASLFLGASVAISSTMVVSRVFEDRPVQPNVRRHVMGVLVIQDVAAIVLAAVLTAVAAGKGLSAGEIGSVVGRLALVLLAMVALGLLVIPRLVRSVARSGSAELMVVVCMGVCFGLALAAEQLGYSVALGAFFAGMLVAESGQGKRVEHLASPLRDTFAAIFFVAIGMTVDPRVALAHLDTSLLVFAVVVVVQFVAVALAGVLSGIGLRVSLTSGLALGQVGEFGFILSAIGIEAGLAPAGLGPIVVTVAVLTAFTTPLALRMADPIVRAVDHVMPRKVQDVLGLYEGWLERFRSERPAGERSILRRTGWIVALEGLAATGILVTTALALEPLRATVARQLGLAAPWDRRVVILGGILAATIPGIAFVRAARALGVRVADRVFGAGARSGGLRPRKLLEVAVQLTVLLVVGIPCAVISLPFAGGWVAVALAAVVALTALALWRTAGRTAPEVRTNAELLVDLLARQTTAGAADSHAEGILGLDRARGVQLGPESYAVGQTLADLDLRAETGATVVAIRDADEAHRLPSGREPLQAGYVLALAGTKAAIDRGRELLLHGTRFQSGEDEDDDGEDPLAAGSSTLGFPPGGDAGGTAGDGGSGRSSSTPRDVKAT